jgi:hypothetical protein
VPGQPKTRKVKEQLHQLAMRENINGYRDQDPTERATTIKALKKQLLSKGIVEHHIDPTDALQVAIDDTTLDYKLIREQISAELADDPDRLEEFFDHPLYPEAVRLREQSARYSTYAIQYKLAERHIRLSETRTALLAYALQTTLEQIGLDYDTIKRVPGLLMKNLMSSEHAPHIDILKAEALAEILVNGAEVDIIDVEPNPANDVNPEAA